MEARASSPVLSRPNLSCFEIPIPIFHDVKKRTCWRLWLLPERWWGSQGSARVGQVRVPRAPSPSPAGKGSRTRAVWPALPVGF